MKCPSCFYGFSDEEILAEAKAIKRRHLTEEERMHRSEQARKNVSQRWAKARGDRK